ncbi:MAG: P1 family peptidase, partial [bacterium]
MSGQPISRRKFLAQATTAALALPITIPKSAKPHSSMLSERRRLRELGIVIGTLPIGKWNAITDVPGVKVGHYTRIEGEGELIIGRGPIRTGVTVIL